MKATELRIGNKILYKSFIVSITMIGEFGVTAKDEDGSKINAKFHTGDLKPISLDKENLLKFGLKESKNEDNVYWININNIDKQLELMYSGGYYFPSIIQAPEFNCEDVQIIFLNKIEYLHDLQNLYFTLTGDIDLTI